MPVQVHDVSLNLDATQQHISPLIISLYIPYNDYFNLIYDSQTFDPIPSSFHQLLPEENRNYQMGTLSLFSHQKRQNYLFNTPAFEQVGPLPPKWQVL
jgi:hypothetical protein